MCLCPRPELTSLVDRTSIGKEPYSRDSEVYTQLAHAVVHFLGLNSPQAMAEYGLDTAADLVDLISRVRSNTSSMPKVTDFDPQVHDQHIYNIYFDLGSIGCLRFTSCCPH